MKQITKEMCEEANNTLLRFQPIHLVLLKGVMGGCVQVSLRPNPYIESSIVNLSDQFYKILTNYFCQVYDIELSFNNSGDIFWSKQ